MNNANLSINAKSSEMVTATANVVGGSTIALSGGVLHNTVGKNSTNTARFSVCLKVKEKI